MHTRHSEVVYLDYHVVAVCLLLVLAHSRCTHGVFLRVHSRSFDIAETFSSSTVSDSDGSWEEESFLSQGFSDDSSSSSSTNSNSSNKGDN
jgi:hypothetical protein